jgi:hypothetical protein
VAGAAAPHLESWLEHQRRRLRVPGVQSAVRVADLRGVTAVALLGGRLVLLPPSSPDPTEGHLEPTVEGPDTLRMEVVAGFGPAGETVGYERGPRAPSPGRGPVGSPPGRWRCSACSAPDRCAGPRPAEPQWAWSRAQEARS